MLKCAVLFFLMQLFLLYLHSFLTDDFVSPDHYTNVSRFSMEVSRCCCGLSRGFSLIDAAVMIAGEDKRRSHRRGIGRDDLIDDKCNVYTDVARFGVTAVRVSAD